RILFLLWKENADQGISGNLHLLPLLHSALSVLQSVFYFLLLQSFLLPGKLLHPCLPHYRAALLLLTVILYRSHQISFCFTSIKKSTPSGAIIFLIVLFFL